MLFNYTYIHNDAEKLQELVRHIVIDVWCQATDPFSIDLIDNTVFTCSTGETDTIRNKVNRTRVKLKNPIEEIYNLCLAFSTDQKDYIRDAFERNNNIEAICNNTITPIFYDELERNTSPDFASKVKSFFNSLYEDIFGQKPYFINQHYDAFMQENKRLCPTCGLNTLEADASNHRDDYDHYLPKEKYPFNAVNLKNLMPICSDCNKKWKKTNNPVMNTLGVASAYYYYSSTVPDVDIKIIVNNLDICDLNIVLLSATMQEKVDSWNRVYSIGRRYKEHVICHNEVGKGWLRKAKADFDRDPSYSIDNEIDDAKAHRLENKNFIRAPFLEECKNKGLIFDEENALLEMIARGLNGY